MQNNKLEQLLTLASLIHPDMPTQSANTSSLPFIQGDKVFIRTVTHYRVGEVVSMNDKFIELKNASWVADSKRWHNALKDGFPKDAEIEPEPTNVLVAIGAIIDVREWLHELPTKQQ